MFSPVCLPYSRCSFFSCTELGSKHFKYYLAFHAVAFPTGILAGRLFFCASYSWRSYTRPLHFLSLGDFREWWQVLLWLYAFEGLVDGSRNNWWDDPSCPCAHSETVWPNDPWLDSADKTAPPNCGYCLQAAFVGLLLGPLVSTWSSSRYLGMCFLVPESKSS